MAQQKQHAVIRSIGSILTSALLYVWASTALGELPNFIVIMADDMGYGDASCYGNDRYQTPHIDALARGGLRFTDFHSNGAVCSPTRAALLTGRYQQRAGIPAVIVADPKQQRHYHGLQKNETTFAAALGRLGYATAIFGKWHLGYERQYNPIHRGFGRFRGYVSGNVDFFSHVDQAGNYDWWEGDQHVEEDGYTTHLITKHAIEFIQQNKDRPFCLYLPHEAPHYPYQGPGDKADRAVGGKFSNHGSRKDKAAAYREMMVELDKSVGAVVEAVKKAGVEDRTLILFFSDNGATQLGNNGVLRGRKGTVWEGGHRVPGIAYWPGKIKPDTQTNDLAITMDIMPTLLRLAGVKDLAPFRFDGVDLTRLLLTAESPGGRRLFWQHGNALAMREGAWKLVRNARGQKGAALYNLSKDLGEQENVAGEHPERARAMQQAIQAWQVDVGRDATPQPSAKDAG